MNIQVDIIYLHHVTPTVISIVFTLAKQSTHTPLIHDKIRQLQHTGSKLQRH